MGQSLNPLRTHEPVAADVKAAVSPIVYTPADDDAREHGQQPQCPLCGEYYGFWTRRRNCDWCGRELCARCCPPRHLLGDKPACPECTRRAFQQKRQSILQQHYSAAGLGSRVASTTTTTTTTTTTNDDDDENEANGDGNDTTHTPAAAAATASDDVGNGDNGDDTTASTR